MARDDDSLRDEPFDDARERQGMRAARIKSDKMWIIVGPIYAVFENWKALGIVGVIIIWINRPEILAALKTLAGVGQ